MLLDGTIVASSGNTYMGHYAILLADDVVLSALGSTLVVIPTLNIWGLLVLLLFVAVMTQSGVASLQCKAVI